MTLTKEDIEELKKLPPRERVKRITEIKKQRELERKKAEVEERKMVSESLKEIELDQMLQEIEVPKDEKVKIESLFEKEGDISDQIKEEKIRIDTEQQADYAQAIGDVVNRVQNTYQQEQQMSRDEWHTAYEEINREYQNIASQLNENPVAGHYKSETEERLSELVESKRILKNMGYRTD